MFCYVSLVVSVFSLCMFQFQFWLFPFLHFVCLHFTTLHVNTFHVAAILLTILVCPCLLWWPCVYTTSLHVFFLSVRVSFGQNSITFTFWVCMFRYVSLVVSFFSLCMFQFQFWLFPCLHFVCLHFTTLHVNTVQ